MSKELFSSTALGWTGQRSPPGRELDESKHGPMFAARLEVLIKNANPVLQAMQLAQFIGDGRSAGRRSWPVEQKFGRHTLAPS